jgi:diguanylate cyclase (GGDEF)-like protein
MIDWKLIMDLRLKILDQARKELELNDNLLEEKKEILQSFLALLSQAIVKTPEIGDKEKTLEDVGKHLLDSQHLLLMLEQYIAELNALRRISINLTSRLELKAVLETVVSEALRLVKNADDVNIFLFNEGNLTFGAALDSKGEKNHEYAKPRPNGLTATVARQKKMIMVEDLQTHPLFINSSRSWHGSIIGIPLMIGSKVEGVMNLARTTEGGFSEDEIRLLGMLADQAAVAILNAGLHEHANQEARLDSLTGLPNRRALDERLEAEVKRASRSGTSLAVVMMDLDGFKTINDTYGHAIGDQVLCQAFQPLVDTLRTTDFLARYGGDELTLVLPETDLASARLVAEKIQEKLRSIKIEIPDEKPPQLDFSGGIAIYPQHGLFASDLLRAADEALYRAKRRQRGNFLVANDPTVPLIHNLHTSPPLS